MRRRKRALTHGRRDAKSQSATRFYTAGYPRLLSYTGCPKHVELSFTFSKAARIVSQVQKSNDGNDPSFLTAFFSRNLLQATPSFALPVF